MWAHVNFPRGRGSRSSIRHYPVLMWIRGDTTWQVLRCLLHLPQVDFAMGTAESIANARRSGESWAMCRKHCNTCQELIEQPEGVGTSELASVVAHALSRASLNDVRSMEQFKVHTTCLTHESQRRVWHAPFFTVACQGPWSCSKWRAREVSCPLCAWYILSYTAEAFRVSAVL